VDLKKLQPSIERQLALLGYELVLLETAREGGDDILRLFVDHLDAPTSHRRITLDDCVAVNEGLLAWMDVEFPDLRETTGIEVSSPGIERPLAKAEHFLRFQGCLCRIQTRVPVNGQKRFKGWIVGVEGPEVVIEEDGAIKRVPLEELQKAKLAPFDEEKTPKPKQVQARLTSHLNGNPEFHDDNVAGVETSADEEA
jgi:ribosome maturation factor RimP